MWSLRECGLYFTRLGFLLIIFENLPNKVFKKIFLIRYFLYDGEHSLYFQVTNEMIFLTKNILSSQLKTPGCQSIVSLWGSSGHHDLAFQKWII